MLHGLKLTAANRCFQYSEPRQSNVSLRHRVGFYGSGALLTSRIPLGVPQGLIFGPLLFALPVGEPTAVLLACVLSSKETVSG